MRRKNDTMQNEPHNVKHEKTGKLSEGECKRKMFPKS